MEIKRTAVEKIRIEGINESHNLDPVEVIIENHGEGQGKIIITCYGQSWTGYWGAMGCTVEEFFQVCNNDYLIGKMAGFPHKIPDEDGDQDYLRSLVLVARRRKDISKEEARDIWDQISLRNMDRHYVCGDRYLPRGMDEIEGMCEPWHLDWPRKVNPEYEYLGRILDLVREVIKPEVNDGKN